MTKAIAYELDTRHVVQIENEDGTYTYEFSTTRFQARDRATQIMGVDCGTRDARELLPRRAPKQKKE
jgi:hypothetical protein